jgi:predicted methyltransferase
MSGDELITITISDKQGRQLSSQYSLIEAEQCKINYHDVVVKNLIRRFNEYKSKTNL